MAGRRGETRFTICGIKFEFMKDGKEVIRRPVGQGGVPWEISGRTCGRWGGVDAWWNDIRLKECAGITEDWCEEQRKPVEG